MSLSLASELSSTCATISYGVSPESDQAVATKSSIAKQRWKILCNAVTRTGQENYIDREISVRRFSSFHLFQVIRIPSPHVSKTPENNERSEAWFEYLAEDLDVSVKVCLRSDEVRVRELLDFDNTGNVCLWPSEEVLAFYLVRRPELCRGKTVGELGGGMTCLAGLFAAHLGARRVVLSDGNVKAVANVRKIIEANNTSEDREFLLKNVNARVLRWDAVSEMTSDLRGGLDLIISADCLFFDDFRQSLVDTIDFLLAPGGKSLIFAPRRKRTMEDFCALAEARGFLVKISEHYDHVIGVKLQAALRSKCFDKDIHYPLMVELTRH